jgi:tuftelin-interacting protein 11
LVTKDSTYNQVYILLIYSNEWDPYQPDKLIELFRNWYSPEFKKRLIPIWMWQNIATQLILPKIIYQLENWTCKDLPLHAWLFPWVPSLGDLFIPLFDPIRRKLDQQFKNNDVSESIALISPWVDVLPEHELKKLTTATIIPKLIIVLRQFKIDPQNQQIEILEIVLKWKVIIGLEIMSYLLSTEFFNKWHEVLWKWIMAPKANFDQITQVLLIFL